MRDQIRWDGQTDNGVPVADGTYEFALTAWDINGNKDTLTITQEGSEEQQVTAEITNASGKVVRTFSWQDDALAEVAWEGRNDAGEEGVRVNGVYQAVLELRYEDGRLKIRISNITFAPNSPEYVTDDVDRFEKNIEIITRIAEILNKFDTYDVLIEGHAVNITGTDREQREELVPLSRSRAETARDSLVERRVNRARLSVAGVGGLDPIVPHTDLDERWRNRPVEFIFIR